MDQISLFDGTNEYVNNKPIRLIECFAGYGSQALSLKYLGVPFEHHRISEWAVKSIQAYKDMHFPDDNTDYSHELTFEQIVNFLFSKGVSADYNSPMTKDQIKRMGEAKCRTIYNNIIATNNLVSICNIHADDLDITNTDKFTYLLCYSFPCQDLSNAGLGKGMARGSKTRSGMLWEVERILSECVELPQILVMENVPQVIGEKNIRAFGEWISFLDGKGYHSKWAVLNGTDFNMPQNRKRCFMVSILGDYYYKFPDPIGCTLRLKDLLEDNVSEEYYLSDTLLDYFISHTAESKEKGNGFKFEPSDGNVIGACVTTRARSRMDDNYIFVDSLQCHQVGSIVTSGLNDMTGRVYSSDGASPTVRTFCGGGQEIKIQCWDGYNQRSRKDQSAIGTLTRNCGADLKRNGQGIIETSSTKRRVRKLTERECFRLMGVRDEDFERVAKNQSRSSLYHLAGDSIITNCLMAIFSKLFQRGENDETDIDEGH